MLTTYNMLVEQWEHEFENHLWIYQSTMLVAGVFTLVMIGFCT